MQRTKPDVVAGMFVMDITADPMVKRQMQRLKEEQISVIVKSVDSCITLQRLTTLFGVPFSRVWAGHGSVNQFFLFPAQPFYICL